MRTKNIQGVSASFGSGSRGALVLFRSTGRFLTKVLASWEVLYFLHINLHTILNQKTSSFNFGNNMQNELQSEKTINVAVFGGWTHFMMGNLKTGYGWFWQKKMVYGLSWRVQRPSKTYLTGK